MAPYAWLNLKARGASQGDREVPPMVEIEMPREAPAGYAMGNPPRALWALTMGTWKKGGDRTERLFLWLAGPSRDRTPPRAVCLPLISQLILTSLDAMRPSRIEYAGALGAQSGADQRPVRSYAKTGVE